MIMSDVEPTTSSAPPTNEELRAINPICKHLIANDPDAYYPWTSNLDEIAIEEEQIPIPCGYTAALYAMETATDQQMLDYQALLDTHISAEFAAAVPIMEFMMDEGIKVFTNMHINWDGIQGINLFELDWKEDSPAVMKPACRPIKKISSKWLKKNSIGYEDIFYSLLIIRYVATLL